MLNLQKISIPTASAALFTLATVAPATAVSLYSITELPFNPADINDHSQVVGENYLWENGNLTDLNTLNGEFGSSISASAINNNGAIVGGGLKVNNSTNNAFISNGSTVTALPRLSYCASTTPCLPTTASGINDAGTAALLVDGRSVYVQQPNGSATQAFSFGNPGVTVGAINNNAEVVGSTPSSGRSGPGVGVLYESTNNTRTNLLSPGYCSPPSAPCSSAATTATDINNLGQVVGAGPVSPPSSDSLIHALLWDNPKNNSIGTDLGTLGGSSSRANSINNMTQVVGFSDTNNQAQHAFLWENGTLTDLNNLIENNSGWELTSASEINNQGQIVGTGYFNQEQRGFVLSPVPEPTSTLGILGFSAFSFGLWCKRRQQQKKVVSG